MFCLVSGRIARGEDDKMLLLQAGYDVVAKCRTGNKEDGCAIFYNREKFSLEFSHEVEYNVGEAGILDKDNIAVIAGLKSALSGAQVLIATTHLLFRSVKPPTLTHTAHLRYKRCF